MRNYASINIARPAAAVYDYVRNPDNAAYWQVPVSRYEILAHSDVGVGEQTRWIFNAGPFELEVINTIVAADPPHMIASQHQMTRFLSGPPARPGEPAMNRDELDKQFKAAYGTGEVGGLVAISITPTDAQNCALDINMDTNIGGSAWLITRIQRFLGRNALRDNLKRIKIALET